MRRSDDRSRRRGFTLLEILLVIALIGLMSGFLLTDWGNVADSFGRKDWRETVREAFRRGHFLAETREEGIRLRFDPEAGEFVFEEIQTGKRLEGLEAKAVRGIEWTDSRVTADGRAGSDTFRVIFGADGSATPAFFEVETSTGTVSLRNHPFTGKLVGSEVEVDELPFTEW